MELARENGPGICLEEFETQNYFENFEYDELAIYDGEQTVIDHVLLIYDIEEDPGQNFDADCDDHDAIFSSLDTVFDKSYLDDDDDEGFDSHYNCYFFN